MNTVDRLLRSLQRCQASGALGLYTELLVLLTITSVLVATKHYGIASLSLIVFLYAAAPVGRP